MCRLEPEGTGSSLLKKNHHKNHQFPKKLYLCSPFRTTNLV